jgi:Tol biopolymer transport system component
VAFTSLASNLVRSDTNGVEDVFIRDRQRGTTARVSISSRGGQANGPVGLHPSLSADGRFVAFASIASNLVRHDPNGDEFDVFVRDRRRHKTIRIGPGVFPDISASGRFVAFESEAANLVVGDTNRLSDVFLYDRRTHTTTRVSVSSDGQQASREPGLGVCLPDENGSGMPAISASGRYVAFTSMAPNLVDGDANH